MFDSNQELFEFGRQVRSELLLLGREDLADRLGEVVDSTWTSATEALGELVGAFDLTTFAAGDELPPHLKGWLPIAIREIDDAIDRANSGEH